MLPHPHREFGLLRVHLIRARQQHGIDARLFQALFQVKRVVGDPPFTRKSGGVCFDTAGQCDHFHIFERLDGLDMIQAHRPLSCEA